MYLEHKEQQQTTYGKRKREPHAKYYINNDEDIVTLTHIHRDADAYVAICETQTHTRTQSKLQ